MYLKLLFLPLGSDRVTGIVKGLQLDGPGRVAVRIAVLCSFYTTAKLLIATVFVLDNLINRILY